MAVVLGEFAALTQRAHMVLERCTNAVTSPFGVTGALNVLLQSLGFNDAWLFQGVRNENAFTQIVTQRLNDVFIHKWIADMTNSLETSNRAKTYLFHFHYILCI